MEEATEVGEDTRKDTNRAREQEGGVEESLTVARDSGHSSARIYG